MEREGEREKCMILSNQEKSLSKHRIIKRTQDCQPTFWMICRRIPHSRFICKHKCEHRKLVSVTK